MAKFITELCAILKIDQNLSTAYHPQTDRQSKRANQRVEQYLRIYGNNEKNDWASLLPMAQYTHNATQNESIQATPFKVLIGNTPTIQVTEKDLAVPEIARRKEWLGRGRLRAQVALRNAHQLLEKRMARRKGERHYLGHEEGDLVWLEGTNLQLSHPSTKLTPRRYGPFKITKKVSEVLFRLDLPMHWTIHNVFHASLLTPYWEMTEHGVNYPEPSPDLMDDNKESEVDRIINSRRHGKDKQLQFLIHWKGYSTAHNSWENATDVFAPKRVEEYYRRKRTAI
jgi:hypothetical protein